MDIRDALSISLREGNSNLLSFFNLDEALLWEPKEKYTEKFIPLLKSG